MFTDFLYDNESASDYELLVCRFDSANGAETVSVGSNLTLNTVKPVGRNESSVFGSQYNEDYTATFQCCKVDKYNRPLEIAAEEFSQISRWLNRNDGIHEFKINGNGYENIRFFGTFNAQAIKVNDVIYGVECTLLTNSPYAFADGMNIVLSGKQFSLYDSSDETYEIYPDVKITCNESGNLAIENSLDDEIFEIDNCVNGEVITINGTNRVISSSVATHNVVDDFNYNYIKVVNTYRNRINEFTCSLDVTIEFQYSPIRKVGI